MAVGQGYDDFGQTSDEEVCALLDGGPRLLTHGSLAALGSGNRQCSRKMATDITSTASAGSDLRQRVLDLRVHGQRADHQHRDDAQQAARTSPGNQMPTISSTPATIFRPTDEVERPVGSPYTANSSLRRLARTAAVRRR